jgi:pyridinium-3,5-bisthiocarboxylic acid mononucleotide nickel chelatase
LNRIISAVITAMQILWLDSPSEFTGEALVGALADLGVSPSTFEWELSETELGDYHLHFDREDARDIRAVRFGVHGGTLHMDHSHSSERADPAPADCVPYLQLRAQIESAKIPDFVQSHSLGIFHRIASAKAELVGTSIGQIEFPDSEALECLVTTILSCIGLDQLRVRQIYFQQTSQPPLMAGKQSNAALSGAILSQTSINEQIVATPLGAAILAEFGAALSNPPKLKSARIGHGLGPAGGPGEYLPLEATLGEA